MTPDELIDEVFSSDLVSDLLCRDRLGGTKYSTEAARHYLELPVRFRPDVSLFFNKQYYFERYEDTETAGIDPLLHFSTRGHSEGRSPHPYVDPGHIRTVDRHVLPDGYGIQELHEVLVYNLANPSPYFLLDYYRTHLSPIEAAPEGLLAHFLTHGIGKGFTNPLFDPLWYAAQYLSGLTANPLAALRHFVVRGDLGEFASCPAFSGARYLARYRDVADAKLPALAHYLTRGEIEGRACLPEQDDAAQLGSHIKGRLEASATEIDAAELVASYGTMRRRIDDARQEVQDTVSVAKPELARFEEIKKRLSLLTLSRARKPEVSILVPVLNEIAYTIERLAAIIAARPKASFVVLVADDASTDQSIGLPSKIKNLKVVRQQTNVGFLENCNHARRACEGEFLLLLNNDVQLMPGCLDALLDVLERNPNATAAGPNILYPDGRLQESGCILDRDGISTMAGLFADPNRPEFNYVRDVHYCSGAALMVRSAEVRDVLFDDRFKPAYCEDTDLCLSLLARGRRILYYCKPPVTSPVAIPLI